MRIEEAGSEAVVAFTGEEMQYVYFRDRPKPEPWDLMNQVWDQARERRWKTLIFDLADVLKIDSRVLGHLMTMKKTCDKAKVRFVLRNLQPVIAEVLEICKLEVFFGLKPAPAPRPRPVLDAPVYTPPPPEPAPRPPIKDNDALLQELRLAHLNLAKKWLS